MRTLFVTGSGTDVGKTFVAALVIRELRRGGSSVRALKPVATGFDPQKPADSDAARLLEAQGLKPTADAIAAASPWAFAAPLSPDMAAAREGRRIPFDELVRFCREPAPVDWTVIEGIGGVMVPLDADHTVLDWIAAVGAPTLVVAGSYLGTLSHTLTAVEALRGRGVAIAAIVVSESPTQPVPLDETAAVLARFARPIPVRSVRRGGGLPPGLVAALRGG